LPPGGRRVGISGDDLYKKKAQNDDRRGEKHDGGEESYSQYLVVIHSVRL
jgi:hypothetical protein